MPTWPRCLGQGDSDPPLIGVIDFYRVEGERSTKWRSVRFTPAIIEPGHFRFQCHGEHVFHLEISLGYQHRGVERALVGGPNARSIHYAKQWPATRRSATPPPTARCSRPSPGARRRRGRRRCGVSHWNWNDWRTTSATLGALANDVGFLPTASYCGRLRGDFLNLTATLCGSRFGRGMIRPGGVGFDIDAAIVKDLLNAPRRRRKGLQSAIKLLWDSPVRDGPIRGHWSGSAEDCAGSGPRRSGRSCLRTAARCASRPPSGIFRFAHIPVSTGDSGDVFARAYVRWLEMQRSIEFVREQLQALPPGSVRSEMKALAANQIVVADRGMARRSLSRRPHGRRGRFERYKIVDPSFHNWTGLAMRCGDQQISDFPLCNKSFNLSYCGHDL